MDSLLAYISASSALCLGLIIIDGSHLITFKMVCFFVVKVFLWYSLVCERYEASWLGWLSFFFPVVFFPLGRFSGNFFTDASLTRTALGCWNGYTEAKYSIIKCFIIKKSNFFFSQWRVSSLIVCLLLWYLGIKYIQSLSRLVTGAHWTIVYTPSLHSLSTNKRCLW